MQEEKKKNKKKQINTGTTLVHAEKQTTRTNHTRFPFSVIKGI